MRALLAVGSSSLAGSPRAVSGRRTGADIIAAMTMAASAAAEIAERERERQWLCEAALAPIREAVAAVSALTPEQAAMDERLWAVVQDAFDMDRTLVNLNNGGV